MSSDMNPEDEEVRQVLMALLMGPSPFSRHDVAMLMSRIAPCSHVLVDRGFIHAQCEVLDEDYTYQVWTVSQKGKDFIIKGE